MREIKEGAMSKQEETTGSTHIIKIFLRASDDEMTRNGRKMNINKFVWVNK